MKVDQGNRVGLVAFVLSVIMVVIVGVAVLVAVVVAVVVAEIRYPQPDVMVDSTYPDHKRGQCSKASFPR